MSVTSQNRIELLQIADSVAREKLIEKEVVIEAMEESLARSARSRYGAEFEIRAHIDRKTGALTMTRVRHVVDEVENHFTELTLDDAREIQADAEIGTEITDVLPPLELGRIAAQSAKQVILQKIREAEREKQFEEYKDRIGTIINGTVRRVEYGNVIVDIGRGEAILRRDQLINRETFRPNDRIRALIKDIRPENRGHQITLSRTANEFLKEVYKMEVPEVYDGVIEIRAVARDPGSRAKIGVISYDSSIDPVGALVGMRGSRVQAVVSELQGEKIDIIPWSEDQATFLVNALQPAEVTKVVLDEDTDSIVVVVPDEQLSLAIGRRGQNVRLASQLTGLNVDITTETEESELRQKELIERSEFFVKALDLDEMVAHLLVTEGFTTLEEVAYVDQDEISSINGFDEGVAAELQARALDVINARNEAATNKAKEMGVTDELLNFPGLSPVMIVKLAEDGILTLEEFARVADWELAGGTTVIDGKRVKDDGLLEEFDVGLAEARDLILSARLALGIITEDDLEHAGDHDAHVEEDV